MTTEHNPSTTQLATQKAPVKFSRAGVELATLEDAYRFATAVSKSGFAPKGMESVESILIAVQFGAELGLTPMSALQSLAVVNGRPSIYGDAALALVRGSGFLESYTQSTSGEGEHMKAIVTVKRNGEQPITAEFSVSDAKKASLWGKSGPWTQYPGRMLMWRARGFALRDAFGDVLRGLATTEEVQDIPTGFDHAKSVNEPVKPAFTKKAKAIDTLPAETTIVSPEQKHSPETASAGQETPDKATAAESAKPATGSAQSSSGASQPAPRVDVASPTPETQPEPPDQFEPLRQKVRDAMKTYDFTEDDVLKFAKDEQVLGRSSKMRLDDICNENLLTMLVDKLPKLIKQFTGDQAP